MVGQHIEPHRLHIDNITALSSLRPFSSVSFKVFEDRELKTIFKLFCQALMEKEDKKTLSELTISIEFNCFLLDKVLEKRRAFERDMQFVEDKTLEANLALKDFDANPNVIQRLRARKAELERELKEVDDQLKILEAAQDQIDRKSTRLNSSH